MMGGSLKSKRVTWASDEYLCQVRLFLSEESPSQVESSAQDHLQEKTLCASNSNGTVSDEILPPGFEGSQPINSVSINFSQTPLIKWKCPPKYMINGSWRVVEGEESKEAQVQNLREMRFLEAIYPKASDIPSNPVVIHTEDSSHNDQCCPLIPINPIEDEDLAADPSKDSGAMNTALSSLQQQPRTTSSLDPSMLAAAHAALSKFIGNRNQENVIDNELLMKILSDPNTIEQLVEKNHHGGGGGATASTQPPPPPANIHWPPPPFPSATQGLHLPNNIYSLPASGGPLGGFYGGPGLSPPSSVLVVAPVSRDMNYYKSLIQQHGGEIQDSNIPQPPPGYHTNNHHLVMSNNFKPRELKQKMMRPCSYFNTPRGCRNGLNCTFQHDAFTQHKANNNINIQNNNSSNIADTQNAKRIKTDWRISGS